MTFKIENCGPDFVEEDYITLDETISEEDIKVFEKRIQTELHDVFQYKEKAKVSVMTMRHIKEDEEESNEFVKRVDELRKEKEMDQKKIWEVVASENELIRLTEDWEEHPEWWKIPCLCKLCQSY